MNRGIGKRMLCLALALCAGVVMSGCTGKSGEEKAPSPTLAPAVVDLKAEYNDDYMYVLGNYNAGPKPTKRWQAAGQGKPWDIRAEEISYWETRDYVKRVMGNYWIYQEIYEGL